MGDQPTGGTIGSITDNDNNLVFSNIPKSNSQAYLGTKSANPTGNLPEINTDGYILKTRTLENKSQLVVSNDVYETL